MILWTIQPQAVYEEIIEKGVYRCNLKQSDFDIFQMQYDWLVEQMNEQLGEMPEGVSYPVWTWFSWEGIRKRPDLRRERFGYGFVGDKYVCMEIDIPDNEVVLSDFDAWCMILNDVLISASKDEDEKLEKEYSLLADKDKTAFKRNNWKRVFDLSPLSNDWISRGESVQATFGELKKSQIKKIYPFVSAVKRKGECSGERGRYAAESAGIMEN